MKQHTLLMPLDMHLHLRDGVMLENIGVLSAYSFSGALIMPNLVPPVRSLEELLAYKERILHAVGMEAADEDEFDDIGEFSDNGGFEPYMTLFYQNYDREFLEEVAEELTAIKLYPAGITTNSEGGVKNFDLEEMRPTLEAMASLGIPLCVHGETDGFVMDREAEFMNIYDALATNFPDLKIIMEHITTKEAAQMLDKHPNLYATITVHHLIISLDDVAGGMLKPHLFCKPIAKRPEDRAALLELALNAHPKVMFGSDSAPHPKDKKESCGCAAGVFTAPIALQSFVSDNAQSIYGICPEFKEVTLVNEEFKVPESYKGVVPMYAGETIGWSIEDVD
ncbi:dihydroorotase [Campylobacterota bacterium]